MNAAAQRRLTAPLAVAAVLLGLLCLALLGGLGRGVHWAAPRAPVPLPAQRAATLPPPVPLERYASVWQQPLFNPDRKPVVHAASGGSQLGDMQLTGIILTPALRMALLHNKRDREDDRELRIREGARLPDGDWTLVEVKPRSAVFDSASGRVELELPVAAKIDVHQAAAQPDEVPQVPNQVQEERPGHRLQPPEDDDQPDVGAPGATSDQDDDNRGGTASAAPRGASSGGALSNDARQAERLRLLKAAIEKRRAEQAAAKAHEGER
jgi:general secretion pathway protein N